MIIVKTKNGDHFINDQAVTEVSHDRENATVGYYGANGVFNNIKDVEAIVYTNEAQPMKWEDDGSEIKRLFGRLQEVGREKDQIYEHSRFMREWFFIYQEAFDKIKSARQAEREGKAIYRNIDSIIEQAESDYAKSQKKFEEVSSKWRKEEADK